MRGVIIDDEKNIREVLKSLLARFSEDFQLIGEANSVSTGRELILEAKPEIIFVDVELGDGTGIELIRSLQGINAHVIFITAHDKYAVEAFRLSALDFLLKPFDPQDLVRALGKVSEAISSNQLEMKLRALSSYMNESSKQKKIVLSDADNMHIIDMNDILWCSAEGSYTRFFIANSVHILVSKNLKSYEEILDSSFFLRIHHSHLVNINHIKRFERSEGGTLIMSNEVALPVSVRKRDALMQLLKNWNGGTLIK